MRGKLSWVSDENIGHLTCSVCVSRYFM